MTGSTDVPAIKQARASDYDQVAAVVDQWWGRPVVASLPRLFLDHFWPTSLVAEDKAGLAGFLIGWSRPARPAWLTSTLPGCAPTYVAAAWPAPCTRGLAKWCPLMGAAKCGP